MALRRDVHSANTVSSGLSFLLRSGSGVEELQSLAKDTSVPRVITKDASWCCHIEYIAIVSTPINIINLYFLYMSGSIGGSLFGSGVALLGLDMSYACIIRHLKCTPCLSRFL